MRGARARRLRKAASAMCVAEGTNEGKGYNEYNQAMNRLQMRPALDKEGFPMMVGGEYLMKPEKTPGTVTCAWVWRNIYKTLKRMYKSGKR